MSIILKGRKKNTEWREKIENMDDAVEFFLILNLVSILVFLGETDESGDWMTDFIALTSALGQDIGEQEASLAQYSSSRLLLDPDTIFSLSMINSSSHLCSSVHSRKTCSLSSPCEES